jgi:hypothetical protein
MVHNSPEVTPGGRALKFYSSVRLDIRRIESIKDGVEVIGNRTRVKVVKNKCIATGTLVYDPVTDESHPIEDVVERGTGTSVLAADAEGNLHARAITGRFDQGEQEVVPVELDNEMVLWCTPDHRVMTLMGWVEARSLRPGTLVATVDTEWVGFMKKWRDDHGDGSVAVMDPVHLSQEVDFQFVRFVGRPERRRTYDLEVEELHTFVANGIVVHNCSAPFRQAEFDIMYGKGISREGSVIDLGVDLGIVKKSGAWFTYEGEQLGQGREKAKEFLVDNPELMVEITDKVMRKAGIGGGEEIVEAEPEVADAES